MNDLSALKRDVSLIEFARGEGYVLDKKESRSHSETNQVLRHPDGDKLCVSRRPNGDWTYYSFRDEKDNGTIVDFVLNRSPNSTDVKDVVRAQKQKGRLEVVPFVPDPRLAERAEKQREAAKRTLNDVRTATHHQYLTERHLLRSTTNCPRFQGTWGVGRLTYLSQGGEFRQGPQNVAFLYRTTRGVESCEMRNHNAKILAATGDKGLWASRCYSNDNTLVGSESPIDSMSYHQLKRNPHARNLATGGSVGEEQLLLIGKAMRRMPPGSQFVAAFDNDRDGHRLTEHCRKLANDCAIAFSVDTPQHAKDWNKALELHLTQDNSRRLARGRKP